MFEAGVEENSIREIDAPFSKCFPHQNLKSASLRFKSSGVKSRFEKLRLRDGLVWALGLAVEIKLRFQISTANWRKWS